MPAKRKQRPEMSWVEKRQQWRKRITINGKSHDVYGKTKDEVRAKIKDLQRQVVAGVPLGRSTTFVQYAAEWLKVKTATVRESTSMLYCRTIDGYILPMLGNMKLSEIKPLHVQQLLAKRPDLSRATQERILITLNQIMESAVDNDLLLKNPCKGIKPGGDPTKEKTPLTKEQQQILCDAVKGTQIEVFVLLCLYAGLRREEALGLTWSHVYLNTNAPYIEVRNTVVHDVKGRPVFSDNLKTPAARRDIPIPDKLTDALLSVRKQTNSMYVIPAPVSRGPMRKTTFDDWWRRATENLDFYVHAHLLRHTYITELCHAGLDIKTIQYLAGHADVKTTLKIYAHTINNRPEQLSGGIKKIFSGSIPGSEEKAKS